MDLNAVIERIIMLHDKGGNPQQLMQQMFGQNPNINQLGAQMQNMSKGMTRGQFYLQLAKQGGVSEQNIQRLTQILGVK